MPGVDVVAVNEIPPVVESAVVVVLVLVVAVVSTITSLQGVKSASAVELLSVLSLLQSKISTVSVVWDLTPFTVILRSVKILSPDRSVSLMRMVDPWSSISPAITVPVMNLHFVSI